MSVGDYLEAQALVLRIAIIVSLIAGCVVLRRMNQRAQIMNEQIDAMIQTVERRQKWMNRDGR